MKDKRALFFGLLGGLILAISIIFLILVLNSKDSEEKVVLSVDTPTPKSEQKEVEEQEISFSPNSYNLHVGEALVVDIVIDNPGKEMIGVDLGILYDPTVLEFIKISPGDFFLAPQILGEKVDLSTGKIFYSIGSFKPSLKSGVIASFYFKAKAPTIKTTLSFMQNTQTAVLQEEETELRLGKPGEYNILK